MSEDGFKIKLKWKVYNQEFKEISGYSYSFFKFNFKIRDQKLQEEFAELVGKDEMVMPWEVCDFFLSNGIKYSLHFRYLKDVGLKGNLKILKTVLELKFNHLRIIIGHHIYLEKQVERKLINGRERLSIMLKLNLPQRYKMYFFQADSNIWWLPKILRKESDLVKIVSFGWLFGQVGRCIYNREG